MLSLFKNLNNQNGVSTLIFLQGVIVFTLISAGISSVIKSSLTQQKSVQQHVMVKNIDNFTNNLAIDPVFCSYFFKNVTVPSDLLGTDFFTKFTANSSNFVDKNQKITGLSIKQKDWDHLNGNYSAIFTVIVQNKYDDLHQGTMIEFKSETNLAISVDSANKITSCLNVEKAFSGNVSEKVLKGWTHSQLDAASPSSFCEKISRAPYECPDNTFSVGGNMNLSDFSLSTNYCCRLK